MRNLLPLAALLCFATPRTLPAQSAVSFQAGVMTAESHHALEVGVRVSPAQANTVGFGFSLDAVPDWQHVLLGLTDVSVIGTIGLVRDVRLELRAGGSIMFGVGGGGALALGYHLGAGMVADLTGPVGLRADYTWRHLRGFFEESLPLPSLTIGVVLQP